jgi:type VI secretion system protein ImpH
MATGGGTRPDDLTHYARLVRSPEKHHLFHALRIIEAHHAARPRLGESRRASQDKIRLTQDPELAFQPTSITSLHPASAKGPARLVNRVFGLFGTQGPLPLHLTEYARDRLRNHRDPSFVAFANMLTHRLMSLFYRAWAAGQPAPSFDRDGNDPVERRVAAIAGYQGEALRRRDAMPDLAKRHFAGHLASGSKHPEGLVSMLSAFFAAPVHLQQFIGEWLTLEPDDRWQLGARAGLGRTTSIGFRVWSRASKFRLLIGPLDLATYKRLLPGQGALERLEAIVRNYVGDRLDWDVNLILTAAEVPRTALGASAALGHTTWVGARREIAHRDADDLYLTPPSQTKAFRALAGH